jgi:hypothetical protein
MVHTLGGRPRRSCRAGLHARRLDMPGPTVEHLPELSVCRTLDEGQWVAEVLPEVPDPAQVAGRSGLAPERSRDIDAPLASAHDPLCRGSP